MITEPEKEYRTFQIDVKEGHKLYPYFEQLCLNSNNLYNSTNFYIRQVYTALNNDKKLQTLQNEVMETIFQNIDKMNEKKTIAHFKKHKKEMLKPEKERKKLELNLFDLPSKEKTFLGYNFLDCLFKTIKQKDYYSLPAQINQQVIKNVVQNWESFFESVKDYKEHPEKYKSKPNIPSYMPKASKKEVVLSNQICKVAEAKYLQFPKTKWRLNIGKIAEYNGRFQQVRVLPKRECFTVEVIYLVGEKVEIEAKKERCMSIDLGVENIATLVFNTGLEPIIFKGGVVKSINQWYNKMRGYFYTAIRNGKSPKEGQFSSKKLIKLDNKRNNQIKDFFHKVSFHIVDIAKKNHIDTIIIGKNKDWKQEVNLGTKNNQNFTQIPHSKLISKIKYKANAEGIAVIVTEESYTSKASFLDEDDIPTYKLGDAIKNVFSGKRVTRGMYRTKSGKLLNADVNGSANILRKVIPTAFVEGIAAVCSPPLVVNVR